jgi:hypothetical protein
LGKAIVRSWQSRKYLAGERAAAATLRADRLWLCYDRALSAWIEPEWYRAKPTARAFFAAASGFLKTGARQRQFLVFQSLKALRQFS